MKVPYIIGADLSKKTIDFASQQLGNHVKVENNLTGFNELMRWMKQLKIPVNEVMIVMEHTGLYSHRLEQFLHQKQVSFTKVSGLAIKLSMGMVRGKTDKQDAFRIAQYGEEKTNQLVATPPVDKPLERLQILHSTRERMVRMKASLMTAVKEYHQGYGLEKSDRIITQQLEVIESLDKKIKEITSDMEIIVEGQQSLTTNYKLLKSIKGVGQILALAVIIKTGNFTRFTNPRKFACYCGTAPFENSSGTSIRRKTRVSHLADKRMKTLLDLAAKSAIQHDHELQAYYLRRTENGKSKMSTINVVRNKLLYRIFAVVKRQTPFIERNLSQTTDKLLLIQP